jgi:hypothetical protein
MLGVGALTVPRGESIQEAAVEQGEIDYHLCSTADPGVLGSIFIASAELPWPSMPPTTFTDIEQPMPPPGRHRRIDGQSSP